MKILLLLLLLLPWLVVDAAVMKTVAPETGLVGWKLQEENFEMELVQRLPDQTRAFFMARGFTAGIADQIALSCIMQTIVRNSGRAGQSPSIRVDLHEWRMKYREVIRPVPLKETRLQQWSKEQVTLAARIAFRWSTFPTTQEFAPQGDFNWGMTFYDLPAGESFDLYVVWHEGTQRRAAWLRKVQCAGDRTE